MTSDEFVSQQGWDESINVSWLKFKREFPSDLNLNEREMKLMRASFYVGWKNGTDYAMKAFEIIIGEIDQEKKK